MIDKKINSRAKRDTCSIDRYDVIEKYIVLYRKGDTMHIKVSFDLFWEIYAGEVRACSFVSPFFSTCAHARTYVRITHMYQPPPHAHHEHRGTKREYVHWTLTRKRRGRFVLGLRQQVDEIRAYGTPSTEMNKWRKRSIAFRREAPIVTFGMLCDSNVSPSLFPSLSKTTVSVVQRKIIDGIRNSL